jgi:hypothetical protein
MLFILNTLVQNHDYMKKPTKPLIWCNFAHASQMIVVTTFPLQQGNSGHYFHNSVSFISF